MNFGTDGIRGTYGSTIDDGTAYLLGRSLALVGGDDCPIVVIARDTRASGEKLSGALAAGVYEGGGNVINLGILPTNAVAHFTRKFGADFGVMVTASHNPPCDNGLKVFDRYGVKLCGRQQKVVSALMDAVPMPDKVPHVCEPVFYDIDNVYRDDVVRAVGANLADMSVALDCCYGASYRAASAVFGAAGANVTVFNAKPCGEKINVECGATCPQNLLQLVARCKDLPQLSFAFDGDCDRLLVAEGDKIVPNGKVYFAICRYLSETGKLVGNAAVGTILTNGGVEQSLNRRGIKLVRTDVGDQNVFAAMAKRGLNFGGEESGHYLLTDYATSSDALINALFVANIYKQCGSLFEYTSECDETPSVLQSVVVGDAFDTLTAAVLADESQRVQRLYPDCRLVLRKSGTERKLRIYAEGEQAEAAAQEVATTFCK